MLAILGLFGLAMVGMVMLPDAAEDEDETSNGRTDVADPAPDTVPLHEFLEAGAGTEGHDASGVVIRGTVGHDLIRGDDGDDRLFGGNGDDTIDGGRGDDVILGGPGQDTLNGHVGDDIMRGGLGDDSLNGGDGDDWLHGGAGDDTIMGYWGDDTLIGGAGADTLFGGEGNDIIDGRERGQAGADFLNGGTGDDTIMAGAFDTVHGGTGADVLALTREEAATGAATLQDFDAAEDRIVVYFDGAHPPVLEQAETEGGVMLLADGLPLALVEGVSLIDLAAIELVAA